MKEFGKILMGYVREIGLVILLAIAFSATVVLIELMFP
jgi:hypothetical protein